MLQVRDQMQAYETALRKQALNAPYMDESFIQRTLQNYQQLLEGNQQLSLSYDIMAERTRNAEDAMMSWYNTSMESLLDVIFESKNFSSAIGNIAKSLARMAVQILVLEPLANMFRQMVTGTNAMGQPTGKAGWGSAVASFGMKLFGFAGGGNPPVGKASLVGENGPELFIPNVSGSVVPAQKTRNMLEGSGPRVHIDARTTIDARGATIETVNELKTMMAMRDAQLRAQLPTMIDARVIDSRNRARF
jgi:hypothetical protein